MHHLPPPIGGQTAELYYHSREVWPTREIRVCWVGAGYALEKSWVESANRGQRSWAATGDVVLRGWERCRGDYTGIAILSGAVMAVLRDPNSFNVEMNLDFGPKPEHRYTRCVDNQLSREACIKTMSLHEFGHALGYAHEHNREDGPGHCTTRPQGPHGDRTIGPWDGWSIMNYCSDAVDLSPIDRRGTDRIYGQRLGRDQRLADFNGDGTADLLCNEISWGRRSIDFGHGGTYAGPDVVKLGAGWCTGHSQVLMTGDIDGDRHDDLICFDAKTGQKWVDFADLFGQFENKHNLSHPANGWCASVDNRILVDDFDGDGRDDFLCFHTRHGTLWMDYAQVGSFGTTDWSTSTRGWCTHSADRIYTGDFDGDGQADLLCHNRENGRREVRNADLQGHLPTVSFQSPKDGWCAGYAHQLFVGNFDTGARDDLLCVELSTGAQWIDFADSQGRLTGTDVGHVGGWCAQPHQRIYLGDTNRDGMDDLVCHDIRSGSKWTLRAGSHGLNRGSRGGHGRSCSGDNEELL